MLSGRLLAWVVILVTVVIMVGLIRFTFVDAPTDAANVHLRIWRRLGSLTPLRGVAVAVAVFINELASLSVGLYFAAITVIALLTFAQWAWRPGGRDIAGWARRQAP